MATKPSGLDGKIVAAGRDRLIRNMFGPELSADPATLTLRDSQSALTLRDNQPASAQGLAPGTRLLGKYEVERELGKGGMGVVLAVRHLELDELFALKLLLPTVQSKPAMSARFIREARTAARLTSPHVARVHDVGELPDGTPYLLMEHLEGHNLSEYVAARGILSLEHVIELMLQACDALSEAHASKIVHRDLKPANMFVVQRHTGEAHLKLLDFGIVKDLAAEELTKTGTLVGTPYYMSPELLRGSKTLDARADIWALGVILYELTTGSRPFSATALGELIDQVLHRSPERPSERRPSLPPALDEVIMRCLSKAPEQRYPSLAPLMDDLNALRASAPAPSDSHVADTQVTTGSQRAGSELDERPEGIVDSGSPFYVSRPEFEQPCMNEIVKAGALLRIKGPRQVGKTTMMMRLLAHARTRGARIAHVDLQLADARILSDLDQLLRWLCAVVQRRLKLGKPADEWDDVFGPKDNCLAMFEDHILPAAASPLVLALSSVDRLFESPQVADEFLTLMRALHELSKSNELWSRARLVLEYSTEMYLPMDLNHSPFNVGFAVAMDDWDAEIITALARAHGLSWGADEVAALMQLVGGQPYLVRVALHSVARGMSLDELLANAATGEGVFADHLKHLLWRLHEQPELADAAAQVVRTSEPVGLRTELAFKLVSLGAARLHGDNVEAGRELYRRYLRRHLDLI